MAHDLLDQPSEKQKKFNKNNLLYGLCFVVFIGFMFMQMHWPFAAIMIIVGGGLSVGYCVGLLFFSKQHYLFEVAGMILYSSIIVMQVINTFNQNSYLLFFGFLLGTALLTYILLKDRKIT